MQKKASAREESSELGIRARREKREREARKAAKR